MISHSARERRLNIHQPAIKRIVLKHSSQLLCDRDAVVEQAGILSRTATVLCKQCAVARHLQQQPPPTPQSDVGKTCRRLIDLDQEIAYAVRVAVFHLFLL